MKTHLNKKKIGNTIIGQMTILWSGYLISFFTSNIVFNTTL